LAEFSGYVGEVWSAKFSPDGQHIVTASSKGIARLWDMSGKVLAQFQGHNSRVNSASFNSNGTLIVTASDDGVVRLWDMSGKMLDQYQFPGHKAMSTVPMSVPMES
jgi:WD40 repeat protein